MFKKLAMFKFRINKSGLHHLSFLLMDFLAKAIKLSKLYITLFRSISDKVS